MKEIKTIIENILSDNNWGLYYKSRPLETLPSQDGQHIYKISNVDENELFEAIEDSAESVLGNSKTD